MTANCSATEHEHDDFLDRLSAEPIATVALYYADCLAASRKAITFVEEELGLSAAQAKEKQIGYSDRSLGKRIPSQNRKRGRQIRQALQQIGLYKANGRETLRGYVTVPTFDQSGTITGIHAYKLDRHASGDSEIVIGENNGQLAETTNTTINESPATLNGTPQPEPAPQPTPLPAPQPTPSDWQFEEEQITTSFADRYYRIRGLGRNRSLATLKINLLVKRFDDYHVDTFDLYQSRPRNAFINQAASELYVEPDAIRRDLGKILTQLEQIQCEQIEAALEPSNETVELTDDERAEALDLLRDRHLIDRIIGDFEACGVVGERDNKLACYLAATSRLLPQPLAILIQSSSAAGKTSLMDAVLKMMPAEAQVKYSAMTSQSLFYLDDADLKHRILAISEEEGVRQAAYGLKLLQSEGAITIAATGRDDDTGKSTTEEHTVEGPVTLFLTTASTDIDKELENRCVTLTVNESPLQTAAIHDRQRWDQTLDGLVALEKAEATCRLHQNAQRLLKPVAIVNPFAPSLSFRHDRPRTRRDHAKYLCLIQAITLLHQYQRDVKTIEVDSRSHKQSVEYIETTEADIQLANRLSENIFGYVYRDLPEKTEDLLMLIVERVQREGIDQHPRRPADEYRFTRKDIRNWLRAEGICITSTSLHRQLRQLEQREFLLNQRRAGSGYSKLYRLNYDPDVDGPVSDLSIGVADPDCPASSA